MGSSCLLVVLVGEEVEAFVLTGQQVPQPLGTRAVTMLDLQKRMQHLLGMGWFKAGQACLLKCYSLGCELLLDALDGANLAVSVLQRPRSAPCKQIEALLPVAWGPCLNLVVSAGTKYVQQVRLPVQSINHQYAKAAMPKAHAKPIISNHVLPHGLESPFGIAGFAFWVID